MSTSLYQFSSVDSPQRGGSSEPSLGVIQLVIIQGPSCRLIQILTEFEARLMITDLHQLQVKDWMTRGLQLPSSIVVLQTIVKLPSMDYKE